MNSKQQCANNDGWLWFVNDNNVIINSAQFVDKLDAYSAINNVDNNNGVTR